MATKPQGRDVHQTPNWEAHRQMLIAQAAQKLAAEKKLQKLKTRAKEIFDEAVASDPARKARREESPQPPLLTPLKHLLQKARENPSKDFSREILHAVKTFRAPPLRDFDLSKVGTDPKTPAHIRHAIVALPRPPIPDQPTIASRKIRAALDDLAKLEELRNEVEAQFEKADITTTYTREEKGFKVGELSRRILKLEKALSLIRIKQMRQWTYKQPEENAFTKLAPEAPESNPLDIVKKIIIEALKEKKQELKELKALITDVRIKHMRAQLNLQCYFKECEILRTLKPWLKQIEQYTEQSDAIEALEKELAAAKKAKFDKKARMLTSQIIVKKAKRSQAYELLVGNEATERFHKHQIWELSSLVKNRALKLHIPLDYKSYWARINALLDRWGNLTSVLAM